MKIKEAKKELEYRRLEFEVKKELKETQFEKRDIQKGIEAFSSAIAALEKQLPKEPVIKWELYHCPRCGEKDAVLQGDNYCFNCGQALDWGVEE